MIDKVYAVMIDDEIRKGSTSKRWYQPSRYQEKIYIKPSGPKGIVTNLKKHGVNAKVIVSDVKWKDL